jgi:hypothetical protein
MKKQLFGFLLTFSVFTLNAQPFFEYNNRHLSQSHLWNPAFMPQYKATLSFGQTYFGANLVGSNLNNLFGSSETPLQTVSRMVRDEQKQLGLDLFHQTDLFHFGFRSKKSYFALNSTLVNEVAARIPKDLLGIAFLGNGAFIENDAQIDFSGNRFRNYLKNTFSYGRYITNELTVGVNASLINGIADFGLNRALIGIGTDTNTSSIYSLNLRGALEGRASLLGVDVDRMLNDSSYDANQAITDQLSQIGLGTNRGYAFGLGATYRLNESWRFSLSVQNLGSITWNLGAQEVIMNEANFRWNGLDSFGENVGSQLVDSLKNRFEITNRNINSYTTQLKPRYILGAEYFLLPRTQLQAVVGHGFGINGDKTFMSANIHQEIGEWIDLRVGYSFYDFSAPAHRLGLGLSLNLGPIQIFGSVNDILSIVSYGNATTASGMIGLNINIGCRKDRDYDDVPDKRDSCRKTFGVISNNGCPYGFLGESMNNEDESASETEEPSEPSKEESPTSAKISEPKVDRSEAAPKIASSAQKTTTPTSKLAAPVDNVALPTDTEKAPSTLSQNKKTGILNEPLPASTSVIKDSKDATIPEITKNTVNKNTPTADIANEPKESLAQESSGVKKAKEKALSQKPQIKQEKLVFIDSLMNR